MSGTQITMLIAMVLYLFGMMGIGIKLSERTSSVGDFYLAGRKLGPFVTAMSAEASDMSSWLLLGIPGLAYLAGIAEAGWTIIGLAVGTYLAVCRKKTAPLYREEQFHYSSGVFLQPLWR